MGGISVADFERRCVHHYICVRILASNSTPEIDYGLFRPSNVCQACFYCGQVCYNFRPRSVDNNQSESGIWCDQCHVHKRPSCSKVNYEKVSKGQVPLAHLWLLERSHVVPELEIPKWIGIGVEPNHIPPVLPTFCNGNITNWGTFKSTSTSRFIGFMVSSVRGRQARDLSTSLGTAPVGDNHEDNNSSLPVWLSCRFARAGVRRNFDELESDVESNNISQDQEYQFASDESDYQWNIDELLPIASIRSPSPQTRNQVRGNTPPSPQVPIDVGEIPQSNVSSPSQVPSPSYLPNNPNPPSQDLPPFVVLSSQVINQDNGGDHL
ncbi:hypothetical protein INT45_006598 [Circinella minor]|uniref:Uncharacterized protein n=1 Tax=Circinella minor TaxID=1195481 RepID=A0A8H7SAR8_9FUNG|nr:hypothetical protein INT45_006598 [Circinella minor]